MFKKEKILVTGSSGFIGMSLCSRLLSKGYRVLGIDNMNDYYDPKLKKARLNNLINQKNFEFNNIDITDYNLLNNVFNSFSPDKVVNLAAQAGVRYSLENPHSYISSNIVGFMNILECSRHHNIKGLIYASSSSVYGNNTKLPFSISDSVDKPISIYAATKRANELMAHTYSHLYNLHTTGLRFFTVYGPWGRPDMALYLFFDKIMRGKPISVFNNGRMQRDFTYIDDIIDGLMSSIEKNYFCELFNLGNSKIENLMDMIKIIESTLDKKAEIQFMGMQPGDVQKTFADIDYSKEKLGYRPSITIQNGIPEFINWAKDYHKEE